MSGTTDLSHAAISQMTRRQIADALRRKGLSPEERSRLQIRRCELAVMADYRREADLDARRASQQRWNDWHL